MPDPARIKLPIVWIGQDAFLEVLVPEQPAAQPAKPGAGDAAADIDNAGVDALAAAMKDKLAEKRRQGRGGWHDRERCPPGYLQRLLAEHIAKGDPVDVANFAMMLFSRRESTRLPDNQLGAGDEAAVEALHIAMLQGHHIGPIVRETAASVFAAIREGKVPGVMYAPYAEAHMQRQCSDIAAKDAALAKRHQQVKEMHAAIASLRTDLAMEENRGDLHSDLNRRAHFALGGTAEGDGSSWHDIPERITRLRSELEQARRERDEARRDPWINLENAEAVRAKLAGYLMTKSLIPVELYDAAVAHQRAAAEKLAGLLEMARVHVECRVEHQKSRSQREGCLARIDAALAEYRKPAG